MYVHLAGLVNEGGIGQDVAMQGQQLSHVARGGLEEERLGSSDVDHDLHNAEAVDSTVCKLEKRT